MGTSAEEQRIAELTGLPLAAPDSVITEKVNSKIYSRRVVENLGIHPIPGWCCETVDELASALQGHDYDQSSLVVKEAYGVSGKGLVVVESVAKAGQLLRMARRRAAKTGSESLHLVAEHFLAKKFDLNYQFTIDRSGRARFDFVKQALTANGVHLGHLTPVELTADQHAILRETADLLTHQLFGDGFFGVVGVDAILGADNVLYPVLEINARLNLSSYQGTISELFQQDDGVALSKYYPLRLSRLVEFDEILAALGPLSRRQPDGSIVVVSCFGTVNAQAYRAEPHDGRLYATLFAPDLPTLATMDQQVSMALRATETDVRSMAGTAVIER